MFTVSASALRTRRLFLFVLPLSILLTTGCAAPKIAVRMQATGYCNCSSCCGWERGSWKYLKLDFWNRYVSSGKSKGQIYTGLTASGTKPHEPTPGLFSGDSLVHPWMIPVRIVFFPWLMFQRDGTIAADTRYYPFGTRFFIPGYGYGRVEDRGSAIKGRHRIDLYFDSHREALEWGRRKVYVQVLQ